jgi:hypothetical protein
LPFSALIAAPTIISAVAKAPKRAGSTGANHVLRAWDLLVASVRHAVAQQKIIPLLTPAIITLHAAFTAIREGGAVRRTGPDELGIGWVRTALVRGSLATTKAENACVSVRTIFVSSAMHTDLEAKWLFFSLYDNIITGAAATVVVCVTKIGELTMALPIRFSLTTQARLTELCVVASVRGTVRVIPLLTRVAMNTNLLTLGTPTASHVGVVARSALPLLVVFNAAARLTALSRQAFIIIFTRENAATILAGQAGICTATLIILTWNTC